LVRTLSPAVFAAALLGDLYLPQRAMNPAPILLLLAFTGYFVWRIQVLATREEVPEIDRVEVGLLAVLALSAGLDFSGLPSLWATALYGVLLVGLAPSVPLLGILALPLAALSLRHLGPVPWAGQVIHLELLALAGGVVVAVERRKRRKAQLALEKLRLDTEHMESRSLGKTAPGTRDLLQLDDLLYNYLGQVKENSRAHGAILVVANQRGQLHLRELVSDSRHVREGALLRLDSQTFRWIVENRKPLRIGRLRSAERLAYYSGNVAVKSFLGVPVMEGDKVAGVLAVDSLRENAFGEAVQSMLQVASHQVANTLTQIRAHELERRKARDFQFLHEFAKRSNECTRAEDLLDSMLASAHERLRPAFSAIALLDGKGRLRFEAFGQEKWTSLAGVEFDPSQGLAGWVLEGGHYLNYDEGRQNVRRPLFAAEVEVPAFGSFMLHPMATQGDKLGVLCLGAETEKAFDSSAVNFCELLAQLGAQFLLQVRNRQELEALATTDALTGLANRRVFFGRLEEEVKRSFRYEHGLALVLLDVDHFKKINDRFGHPAGDEVLKAVGVALAAEARETDLPARYGGEEFAVILPNTGTMGAKPLAERIRSRVAALEIVWAKQPVAVRVSIGVASLEGEADTVHRLISRADQALYAAKQTGRDRVVEYSEVRAYVSSAAGVGT
jgi:diguanylate cyclase (GGDEF)-like protein